MLLSRSVPEGPEVFVPSERLEKIQRQLEALPALPGVYIMRSAVGRVLYVGKAKRLDHRVRSYFSSTPAEHPKVRTLVSHVTDLDYIVAGSEHEALLLELTLIKEHQPPYNINLKDDKRYPYVKVTVQETYPRVLMVRKLEDDGARYFGPFTDVWEVRGALKFLRTLFPVRSCVTMPARACLDFHIHRCVAPCEARVGADEYRRIVDDLCLVLQGRDTALLERLKSEMEAASLGQEYELAASRRDLVRKLEALLQKQRMVSLDSRDQDVLGLAISGDRAVGVSMEVRAGKLLAKRTRELRGVQGQGEADIWSAWIAQYYARMEALPGEVVVPVEPADREVIDSFLESRRKGSRLVVGKRGDRAAQLENARQNATLALEESLHGSEAGAVVRIDSSVYELQRALALPHPPVRIEGFDISHFQGSETVASLVVLSNARAKRSEYRRYRIRSVEGNNDFASMGEVVKRRALRIRSGEAQRPDLFLIDGGRGQLESALSALREAGLSDIPTIGLAKKLEEIYMPGRPDPLRLPRHSEALRLLQRLRDEAHRFAVTYHRKLRLARAHASEIRNLPGVGPGRERSLLVHFGSLEALRGAEISEISKVPGIGAELARKIHVALHSGQEAGKQTA